VHAVPPSAIRGIANDDRTGTLLPEGRPIASPLFRGQWVVQDALNFGRPLFPCQHTGELAPVANVFFECVTISDLDGKGRLGHSMPMRDGVRSCMPHYPVFTILLNVVSCNPTSLEIATRAEALTVKGRVYLYREVLSRLASTSRPRRLPCHRSNKYCHGHVQ
jgi:hypothetical protein